jgi:hypothetical protein
VAESSPSATGFHGPVDLGMEGMGSPPCRRMCNMMRVDGWGADESPWLLQSQSGFRKVRLGMRVRFLKKPDTRKGTCD